jgi:hypothetical protein
MFCIWEQTATCAPYINKKIGFYNRDEKCLQHGTAGRLNEAVCTPSFKGYAILVDLSVKHFLGGKGDF